MLSASALAFYTVAAFGLAYVVGHSVISRPVREVIALWSEPLITLIECPACLGWWVGLGAGIGLALAGRLAWALILALAFYTAGANFILGRATGLIPNPGEE